MFNRDQPQPPSADDSLWFTTTKWSVVLRVGWGEPHDAARALETLCRAYWPPLYAYVRRQGCSAHDAQDIVQDFIAHLLRRNDLATVGPEKGRFRSYLLAALKNFLVSRARAERALKRGGDYEGFSLDAAEAEALCAPELTDAFSPERAFDRRWARTVMTRALDRLRGEHASGQQAKFFAALQSTLMDGGRVENQAALAAELGVAPGALATAATRLRQRYRALIEEEVTQTLANPANLAEEMQALRQAWS